MQCDLDLELTLIENLHYPHSSSISYWGGVNVVDSGSGVSVCCTEGMHCSLT